MPHPVRQHRLVDGRPFAGSGGGGGGGELDTHRSNTRNPHSVTLEQARSQGNQIDGPLLASTDAGQILRVDNLTGVLEAPNGYTVGGTDVALDGEAQPPESHEHSDLQSRTSGFSSDGNSLDLDSLTVSTAPQSPTGVARQSDLLSDPHGKGEHDDTVPSLNADGEILAGQIPEFTVSDTYPVSNESERLALTEATQGDIAIQSDTSQTYILSGSDPTVASNWVELIYPTPPVNDVFGRSGSVTAQAGDYDVSQIDGAAAASDLNTVETELSNDIQSVIDDVNALQNRTSALSSDGQTFSGSAANVETVDSAEYLQNGQPIDFGGGSDGSLGGLGKTTSANPGFGNWRQISEDSGSFLTVSATAYTDGNTPGRVRLDIDETWGGSYDYSISFARVPLALPSGANQTGVISSIYIPPGGGYRIRNAQDPYGSNNINTVREVSE